MGLRCSMACCWQATPCFVVASLVAHAAAGFAGVVRACAVTTCGRPAQAVVATTCGTQPAKTCAAQASTLCGQAPTAAGVWTMARCWPTCAACLAYPSMKSRTANASGVAAIQQTQAQALTNTQRIAFTIRLRVQSALTVAPVLAALRMKQAP